MKLKLLLLLALSGFILYSLLKAVNLTELRHHLAQFPLSFLFLLCLLSMGISLLKSWRFLLLLKKNDVPVSYWQITKVYFAGQATTPLPGGEAFRAFLLKKELGVDIKKTSSAVIMQAFLVFFSSAIIGIFGSIYYGLLLNVAFITLLLLIFLLYLIANKTLVTKLITLMRNSKHNKIKKHSQSLSLVYGGIRNNLFHRGSEKLPGWTFVSTVAIGIGSNILGGFMIFLITRGYGIELPYLMCFYIYAMSVIIAAVSGIVPGGIGLTEGGISGLLVLMKIPLVKAVPIVLIYRFINLVFYIVIGIVFFLIFYGKSYFKTIRK
jgi:uncharacterized protein (TIRG00374 family)